MGTVTFRLKICCKSVNTMMTFEEYFMVFFKATEKAMKINYDFI